MNRPSRRLTVSAAVLVPVFLTGLVVAIAVVTTQGGRADAGPISVGQPFSLASVVDGGAPATLTAVPGRPTLVAFFAAWCDPCRAELPLVEAASHRAGAPAVIGVDVLDQRPDATALLRHAGVTFPSGFDHDGTVSQRWGVVGLPVTVLVGRDGRIVAYHRGQLRQPQLDALLRRVSG